MTPQDSKSFLSQLQAEATRSSGALTPQGSESSIVQRQEEVVVELVSSKFLPKGRRRFFPQLNTEITNVDAWR